MCRSARSAGVLTLLLAALSLPGPLQAGSVTLKTVVGDIVIELFEDETPATVANFLNYVRDGDYNSSFMHRSVPGFIIQGGSFTYIDGVADAIPTDPPVVNEPGISNLRGTVAMAKIGGNPNSATSSWFINLDDNSENLDNQNGGFTVFGQVTEGMEVVDAIGALQVWNAGSPFGELPLIDYPGTGPIDERYLVLMDVMENDEFEINQGLNDTWYNIATNGQGFVIVIYPGLKTMFLTWFTYDTVRPDESVPYMLGEPGHRWLTAYGSYEGGKAELAITMTSGGVFDSSEPAPVNTSDGTMTVEFESCAAGTISYDITSINRQGEVPIERVTPDNIALCEALGTPAAQ